MRVDEKVRPLRLLLTPGQRADQKGFAPLVTGLPMRGGQQGRPRSRPRRIVADAANLAGANRKLLRRRGIDCIRGDCPPMGGADHAGAVRRCPVNRKQAMQTLMSEMALMLLLFAVVVISGRL